MQAPPAISEYPYDTTVIDYVKLRKVAKTEGEVILTIPAGSVVTVYDRTSNGFVKVKYDGKTGYCVDTHINLANIPAPTPKPGAEKYTELKNGSEGAAVTALQSALAELGYLEEEDVDGKFGSKTEDALKVFQKRNGLHPGRYRQPGPPAQALRGYPQGHPRLPPVCAHGAARGGRGDPGKVQGRACDQAADPAQGAGLL